MSKQKDQQPSTSQSIGIGLIENMFLATKPVRELEVKLWEQLGDHKAQEVSRGTSLFDVAALATDALGNSDPEFLKELYNSGGKIDEEVLFDLGTAMVRGRRKGNDPMIELEKIRARNGW